MEALIPQSLVYNISGETEVSAVDLAKALLALDDFVQLLPDVLTSLDKDLSIQGISLLVEDIEKSSLVENVVVKLFFGSQEQLDHDLDKIRLALKLENPVIRGTFVAALLLAIHLCSRIFLR